MLAAVLWATEAVPLFATSFCVVGLEILLLARRGGLAGVGELNADQFLAPFGSEIIILFMGGFLLSAAVSKHGIDRLIAAKVLGSLTDHPVRMVFGVLALSAFVSMWMSNTATTALMLALIRPVVLGLPVEHRFNKAMVLAVPFGANIGGIGTPVGTPPNAIAIAALRKSGYAVGFMDWTRIGVPVVAILIVFLGAVLYVLYRPPADTVLGRIQPPERVDVKGKLTVVVLLLTIAGWLTGQWHGVSAGVVALLAAASLAALGLLDARDVDGIEWNVLILMWGGLSLGEAMEASGLLGVVKQLPFEGVHSLVLAGGVLALTLGLSTFISNTVTANLVVPLAIVVPQPHGAALAVVAGIASSMAMAMPISTPPNAMACATGRLRVSSMMLVGCLIGLAGAILLLGAYPAIVTWVLACRATPGSG